MFRKALQFEIDFFDDAIGKSPEYQPGNVS